MTLIPKHYYCYWHSKTRPPFVQACMDRYQALNPDWTGHFLSQEDMDKIPKPKNFDKLQSHAHRSDWFRCYTMAKHGGVWLDASLILLKPLEAWVDLSFEGLQGFWIQNEAFENWAFAAPKDSPFMALWRDEFKKAIEMGFSAYKDQPSIRHITKLQKDLPYLTMHLAWRVARNALPTYPIKATRAEKGPYSIHVKGLWGFPFFMFRILFFPRSSIESNVPFIKLRGQERNFVVKCQALGLYGPSSLLVHELGFSNPPIHCAFYALFLGLMVFSLILFCIFVFRINK